jgi:hypothetical protein
VTEAALTETVVTGPEMLCMLLALAVFAVLLVSPSGQSAIGWWQE